MSAFASSALSQPTGRQVRRASKYQVRLNGAYFAGGSIALIFYGIEQRSECHIRDLEIRHLYSSQGWSREPCDLIVIKPNYGQIPWNVQAEIGRSPYNTDSHPV